MCDEEIIIERTAIEIHTTEDCYDCPLKEVTDTGMELIQECILTGRIVDRYLPRESKCNLSDDCKKRINGKYLVKSITIE